MIGSAIGSPPLPDMAEIEVVARQPLAGQARDHHRRHRQHRDALLVSYSEFLDRLRQDKIKEIAGRKGVAPVHIAIQWILNRPMVGSVIAGAKRTDQLEQNVKADQVVLSKEEMDEIDSI